MSHQNIHSLSIKRIVPILVLTASLFVLLFAVKPKIEGDAREYMLMQESMLSHGSWTLEDNDVASLNDSINEASAESVRVWYELFVQPAMEQEARFAGGYIRCVDGQYRSYHFWFYSFCSLPFRLICNLLSIDAQYSFHILHLTLLVWLIFITFKTQFLAYSERVLLSFVWVYTFTVFYFDWIHPELLSTVLLCQSVLFFLDKKTASAILFASFAALQNQPIALALPILYLSSCWKSFQKKSFLTSLFPFDKIQDWVKVILATFIVLLPSVYYYLVYGHPNPISDLRGVSLDLISFSRFFSLWLDWNQGIILGFGGVILILILGIIKLLFSPHHLRNYSHDCFVIVFISAIISIPCLMQGNWNAGSSYMLRYGLWIGCPLVIASIIAFRGITGKMRIPVFFIGLIFHSSSSLLGGMPAKPDHLSFNSVSKKILKWWPIMYNPEPEIFAERLLGYEEALKKEDLFILRRRGAIRKMLVRNLPLKNDSLWVGDNVYRPANTSRLGRVVERGDWVYLNGSYRIDDVNTYDIQFNDNSCKWENWSSAENEYRWSLGKQSTLTFSFPDNKLRPQGLLKLTLQPQGNGGELQVFLNKHLIFEGYIQRKTTIPCAIETETLNLNGENILSFNVSNPQKSLNKLDSRLLGVRFYALSFLLSE